MSLFMGVGLVGLPDTFLPNVLKLIVFSIVTKIACLEFLVFPTVWSFTSASGCTFGYVLGGVCYWDEDATRGHAVIVIVAIGVKAGIS